MTECRGVPSFAQPHRAKDGRHDSLRQHRLQPVGIKPDHHFISNHNRRCGLAVEFHQFAQRGGVRRHILMFKRNTTFGQKPLGRKARRASGLTVQNYALHPLQSIADCRRIPAKRKCNLTRFRFLYNLEADCGPCNWKGSGIARRGEIFQLLRLECSRYALNPFPQSGHPRTGVKIHPEIVASGAGCD